MINYTLYGNYLKNNRKWKKLLSFTTGGKSLSLQDIEEVELTGKLLKTLEEPDLDGMVISTSTDDRHNN